MKARKLLTYRNQLLRNIPCPSPSISHRVPAPLTVPLGRHHKNDTLSSSTYTFVRFFRHLHIRKSYFIISEFYNLIFS
ncbi:hypothetical protein LR48_Vigan02g061900 [Vigna angularis]|uniref:Uncharacterized protein n=1 Tax=Phaseolus angularis TaxID=3914 RepID=A0A0L9TWD6_PHAAN|nr:hypothetical protein LR48_Vigan02g061900 [Vigna angularis]